MYERKIVIRATAMKLAAEHSMTNRLSIIYNREKNIANLSKIVCTLTK